jgi:hypothetical protein
MEDGKMTKAKALLLLDAGNPYGVVEYEEFSDDERQGDLIVKSAFVSDADLAKYDGFDEETQKSMLLADFIAYLERILGIPSL